MDPDSEDSNQNSNQTLSLGPYVFSSTLFQECRLRLV